MVLGALMGRLECLCVTVFVTEPPGWPPATLLLRPIRASLWSLEPGCCLVLSLQVKRCYLELVTWLTLTRNLCVEREMGPVTILWG